MELTAAATGVNLLGKVLGNETLEPHFGIGDPKKEAKCNKLRVFMKCVGRTTYEMQRLDLDPKSTPADALARFEKERGEKIEQRIIQDENKYTLSEELVHSAMSQLSSRCCINLRFVHERAHGNGLAGGIVNVSKTTTAHAKSAATSMWSHLPTWPASSQSENDPQGGESRKGPS